ncbi:MAG TPA: hypothetical protein DDZ76_09785 [Xanthomonadales bacterium]|nr:hypothetical protein [Xanthomonadales bacterium]
MLARSDRSLPFSLAAVTADRSGFSTVDRMTGPADLSIRSKAGRETWRASLAGTAADGVTNER